MTDDPPNPMSAAQRLARPALPRRFYTEVTVGAHDNGFAVMLDGRLAKTPARNSLAVGRQAVAEALAAEWDTQTSEIDPADMPLTRIVNAAIDRVADELAAVRSEVVAYALRDLVCYRAEGPESLVAAQVAAWDPLVAWAEETLGTRLILATGVVPVTQAAGVGPAVEQIVAPLDPLALAALHTVTTLTGSAVIALALANGRLSPDDAWAAAHVDEDWQMGQWGRDEMALARRAQYKRELDAAALILGS